jgi:hypothetical protein
MDSARLILLKWERFGQIGKSHETLDYIREEVLRYIVVDNC